VFLFEDEIQLRMKRKNWIPAFAGMSIEKNVKRKYYSTNES
jgi:hypothetical protein